MTIFSVLKYPISDPPSYAEIHALPEEVFETMVQIIGGVPDWNRPQLYHLFYNLSLVKTPMRYRRYMSELRQLIYEYEGEE